MFGAFLTFAELGSCFGARRGVHSFSGGRNEKGWFELHTDDNETMTRPQGWKFTLGPLAFLFHGLGLFTPRI